MLGRANSLPSDGRREVTDGFLPSPFCNFIVFWGSIESLLEYGNKLGLGEELQGEQGSAIAGYPFQWRLNGEARREPEWGCSLLQVPAGALKAGSTTMVGWAAAPHLTT